MEVCLDKVLDFLLLLLRGLECLGFAKASGLEGGTVSEQHHDLR